MIVRSRGGLLGEGPRGRSRGGVSLIDDDPGFVACRVLGPGCLLQVDVGCDGFALLPTWPLKREPFSIA